MSRHANPTQGTFKKSPFHTNNIHKDYDSVSLNISNNMISSLDNQNNQNLPFKIRVNHVGEAINEEGNEVNSCKSAFVQLKSKKKEVFENIKLLVEETSKKLNDKLLKFESGMNQHYKEQREKIRMHEASVNGLKAEKEELSGKLLVLEENLKKLEEILGTSN
jgi:hypothetical protein